LTAVGATVGIGNALLRSNLQQTEEQKTKTMIWNACKHCIVELSKQAQCFHSCWQDCTTKCFERTVFVWKINQKTKQFRLIKAVLSL